MKKLLKKYSQLATAFILIIATLFSSFTPFIRVSAAETYDVTLNLTVNSSSDVTMSAINGSGALDPGVQGDGIDLYRNGNTYHFGFDDTFDNNHFSNTSISVTCASNKACTVVVTVPNDHGVRAMLGGDTPIGMKVNGGEYDGSPFANNTNIEFINRDNVNTPFDGKAYLIWTCGTGVCYHYFEGLSNTASFVNANTVTADNDPSIKFDTNADSKYFALKSKFETWQTKYKAHKGVTTIDWTRVSMDELAGPIDMRQYEEDAINAHACSRESSVQEEFERCVDRYVESQNIFLYHVELQPVGEPMCNNAFVSYGDRNFKITIYNDLYKGITLGTLDDLSYYPGSWVDGLGKIESYDVSGTTKENPTEITTILLEKTINLKAFSEYNGFNIQSIEALDVPSDAVDIRKVDDEYKFTFNSNFYDKVVFKITDTNGGEYYLRINRITLMTNDQIKFREGEPSVKIEADFYFDRTTSYSDYAITGKIEYKDGTRKVIELENAKRVDDGFFNITYAYEVDQETVTDGTPGKGLKQSAYKYEFTIEEAKKISKVYLNVEYKGSTDTSYAGAFAGSGKGVVIEFKEER